MPILMGLMFRGSVSRRLVASWSQETHERDLGGSLRKQFFDALYPSRGMMSENDVTLRMVQRSHIMIHYGVHSLLWT